MKASQADLIFFDTEFTNFSQHAKPLLISIGLVDMFNNEFYAELSDTYEICDCSVFVFDKVLPQLIGGEARMTQAQLAIRLSKWISERGDDVVLKCDAPEYDWSFVVQLFTEFDCWPPNLRRKCGDMHYRSYEREVRYKLTTHAYWKQHGELRHNALIDARVMRFAHRKAIRI